MNSPAMRHLLRPRHAPGWLLLAVALAGVALAGCTASEGDDAPVEAPQATATPAAPAPTPAPATPPAALGTPSPESLDAALQALIDSMRGGGTDPFAGPPEALPPELRALLEALGIDLLLGAAVLETGGGLAVEVVFAGSPAEQASLRAGDVIVAIDGEPVGSGAELRAAVQATMADEVYVLTVNRGGYTRMIGVERTSSDESFWRSDMLRTLALGLMLANRPGALALPPSLLGELMEETPEGLRVFAVFPGSPADNAGLRAGDYVLAIEGRPLQTLDDLNELMMSFNPLAGDTEVTLRRDGREMTVRVAFRIGGLFGGGAPDRVARRRLMNRPPAGRCRREERPAPT